MSSCIPRRIRPHPSKSLFGKRIGGSLVVYRPILERGVTVVLIDTTVMVAGLVAEIDKN